MSHRICWWPIAVFVTILVQAHTASGCGTTRPVPGVADHDGILYDTPVYNEASKRYFALVWARNANDIYRGATWATANADARAHAYKGIHGRLAIVDALEIHQFLQHTFHPPCEAWIGLRYWCTPRTLEWSNGQAWKSGSFQAWDRNWRQDPFACRSGEKGNDFMPVAYSSAPNGFRWIGKGKGKEYFAYFIEYPTGQP